MAKQYVVTLTEDEQASLLALTTKGQIAARKLTRAHMLLQADAEEMDAAIAAALHVSIATVARVRKRFVEEGLEVALNERPRPGGQRKLDGKQEAFLIALACSSPSAGHTSWTMQVLGISSSNSKSSTPSLMKLCAGRSKNVLKPWQKAA